MIFRRTTFVVSIFALGLVSGCAAPDGSNRTVEYRQGVQQERVLPPSGTYTVARGDTIYGVARQFNLSVRALIDANALQPPFQLQVGQVLVLPSGGDYLVVKGDTLIGVARKTGVPFATLARLNQLSTPYVLQVGQKLRLPATGRKGHSVAGGGQRGVAADTGRSSGSRPGDRLSNRLGNRLWGCFGRQIGSAGQGRLPQPG